MTRRRRIDPAAEASRLRAKADEARDALSGLEAAHEAALDGCGHGPHPAAIDRARRLHEAAEALAVTAERLAGKAVAA
ncbi:MAG TPA: hypothetical protein VG757_08240 [Devosia sp.]|nr:hypothetical protein [Devosia sp.]